MHARHKLLFVVLIVLAIAAAAPAQTADDVSYSLFSNSSFEQGLDGWKFSNGWSGMKDDLRVKVVEVRSDGAKSGQKYLRVTNEQKSGFYGVEQPVKFEANTVYTISWWSRGKSGTAGHEQGANRLRYWGYGGPEYGDDYPYTTKEWTYHQQTIYATQSGAGGVSLWVWPNGYCDIDNLTIRKSFVRADKAAVNPGQTVTFHFDVAGQKPEPANVSYRIVGSDGALLASADFSGTTPLKRDISLKVERVGYYTFDCTTTTAAGAFSDRVSVVATSPESQMDAVRREWQRP